MTSGAQISKKSRAKLQLFILKRFLKKIKNAKHRDDATFANYEQFKENLCD